MEKQPLVCISDFEREACAVLPRNARDYYQSGSDSETALKENVDAFRRLKIIPRLLRDVTNVSIGGCEVLGEEVSSPICVAPSAMHGLAHPDAELATARACAKHGILMGVSTLATTKVETIAEQVPDLKRWQQLYVYKDLDATLAFVKRAEKAGYTAVAVTVDTPFLGKRRADEKNHFFLPSHLSIANFESSQEKYNVGGESASGSGLSQYVQRLQNPGVTWEMIKWLKTQTSMKVVLKGIMCADDAKIAASIGVDGIWVSNHGGRQLDSAPATIEVLPEIVNAVRGHPVEVYLDGGIRTGNDVFKALALGAKAVFIGRPVLWGLACNGEKGVSQVLDILDQELKLTMALSGCVSLKDIKPDFIRHQDSFSKL